MPLVEDCISQVGNLKEIATLAGNILQFNSSCSVGTLCANKTADTKRAPTVPMER
jgi:hypothetical protein